MALWPSEYAGHGVELGRRAAESGYRVVAAAGGDGTAHHVANGILLAGRSDVTFAVIPIGSANDYAFSVRQEFGTSVLDDDAGMWVDVGEIEASGGRHGYFIEGVGLGLSGRVTLESRQIQGLQGPLLYGLAAWRALRQPTAEDWQVQYDDEPALHRPTLLLSVLLGRREGNFLMAPRASLADGQFDCIQAGPVGRWEGACLLPRVCWAGPPTSHPQIHLRQCQRLRLQAAGPVILHTDGEVFSTDSDDVRDIQLRLLPHRLRVKTC